MPLTYGIDAAYSSPRGPISLSLRRGTPRSELMTGEVGARDGAKEAIDNGPVWARAFLR